MPERIIAVAPLTRPELSQLGKAFDRAWPVEEVDTFRDLLDAIDEAERRLGDDPTVSYRT